MKYLLMIAALCTAAAQAEEPKLTYQLSCTKVTKKGDVTLLLSQFAQGQAALTLSGSNEDYLSLNGKFSAVTQHGNTQTEYVFPAGKAGFVEAKTLKSINMKDFCGRGSCLFPKTTAEVQTPAESLAFENCHEVYLP